eukprot:jgi/Chrzof1/3494/Cz12g27150.t1
MDAKQAHMPSAPSDTIMNKLGGAVVEAHLHEDDAAMHRDQQGPESGMNGTSGEELNNLTETVASGLLAMQGRQADINAKIDGMTAAGLEFLDMIKQSFIERMARIKEEVGAFCNEQSVAWTGLSDETQSSLQRLQAVQTSVQSLGIEVLNPRQ